MSVPFYIVYQALEWVSGLTGLTYEEVNVIVYYILVPTVFLALIDKILRKPVCLVVFYSGIAITLFQAKDLTRLADDIFNGSVLFLLAFSHIGIGYDLASVLVCILLPIGTFLPLLYFAFPVIFRRHLPTIAHLIERVKMKRVARRDSGAP